MVLLHQIVLHHGTRHFTSVSSFRRVVQVVRGLHSSVQLLAKTHYQTLGVSASATQADIKKAYFRLSMKFHPDKGSGNEEKFRDLTTAYEVLGNPRLRRMYDRGIISDDQPDASVLYPTESAPSTSEDRENLRASVKTFDKWADQHYSEVFNRSQIDRSEKMWIDERRKAEMDHGQGSSEGVMWISLIIVMLMSFLILPGGDNWKKENGKSSNGPDGKKS